MDIVKRKYKFIEQFMKIVNPEKLERFEALLEDELLEKEIVAYTTSGEPLTQAAYIANNKEAISAYKKGNFKSHKAITEKYSEK